MKKNLAVLILGLVMAGCQPKTPAPTSTPNSPPSPMSSTPASGDSSVTPSASPDASATPSASPSSTPGAVTGGFSKKLEMAGTAFDIQCANQAGSNKLTVTPTGLEVDNAPQEVEVAGTVTDAEVSDLDADGFPEVYVYIKGEGESAPGKVAGFASNKGKSLTPINVPSPSELPEVKDSYKGGDEFAVLEGRLGQRFPAYGPDGAPTGKTKQIQWKLVPGEAAWQLEVDQIVEF